MAADDRRMLSKCYNTTVGKIILQSFEALAIPTVARAQVYGGETAILYNINVCRVQMGTVASLGCFDLFDICRRHLFGRPRPVRACPRGARASSRAASAAPAPRTRRRHLFRRSVRPRTSVR